MGVQTRTRLARRLSRLEDLLQMMGPIPADWITGKAAHQQLKGPSVEIECVPCDSYSVLMNAWRKALRWTDGLDCALSVMLASITSTKSVGDQLWVKIIGPASCGKSTLCEAVSVSRKYVMAKSTIRGFHSGYQTDKTGEEDHSLISQLAGKTLVTKDGDTLLQSPNLGQILSEARDIYDTTSRTSYRNQSSRDYAGIRMTWLLCGTSSLRSIDSSELGERFLDCVIMDGIDDDLEDEILWRVANRTDRNLAIESSGTGDSQYEPEMTDVMQLTGGYVNYLRENAQDILSSIDNPEWALRRCTRLGKFVAYMRARPSNRQDETAEREFAARLVSQMIRLAKCLAAVLNRNSVDEEVMKRVTKVAMDTGRGQTLEIARQLYLTGEGGSALSAIATVTSRTEDRTRHLLRFLKQIGVVEAFVVMNKGIRSNTRWRLTGRMRALYGIVVENVHA